MTTQLTIPAEVSDMIARGALVVANHSGGKDSQAMFALLVQHVPADQLLVVHAELPGEEWEGTLAHVKATIGATPLVLAVATKTFEQMVERRGMFPSPQQRQCTSDLKRDPIDREIRRYLKANPRFGGLVVNAMGMRAQESPARSKLVPVKVSKRNSVAGRTWLEWLPIHDLTADQVFATIAAAGQSPHWAYAAGASRLSCMFCIMASQRDLQVAAAHNPDAYRARVALEKRVGHTINMGGKGLEEVTGVAA
jgi:DNA sulfur modification protein DndC